MHSEIPNNTELPLIDQQFKESLLPCLDMKRNGSQQKLFPVDIIKEEENSMFSTNIQAFRNKIQKLNQKTEDEVNKSVGHIKQF